MAKKDYWRRRQEQLNKALEADEAELKKRLVDIYSTEERKLEKEIASYYATYGVDNVVEYRELLKTVSEADFQLLMERMEDFAAKYPEYAHLMPVRESIYKLNRLEALERSVQMQQLEMGIKEEEAIRQHLERQASRGYSAMVRDLGVTNTYGVFDTTYKTMMHDVVMTRWADGKNFSDRVWANKQTLADVLNGKIASGFARGDGYDQMAKEIRQRFQVAKNAAYRLVYTEGTFVLNEVKARAVEKEFSYYSFSTVGDNLVCAICRTLQAETEARPIRLDERVPGENFPPMHPWCRCTFAIVVQDPSKWIDDYVASHGGDPAMDIQARKEAQDVLDKFVKKRRTKAKAPGGTGTDPAVQAILDGYDRIQGEHTYADDIKAVNPNYQEARKNRDYRYTDNCQRCVSAYEARRRGYDVVAKPVILGGGDTLPLRDHDRGWPNVYKNGRQSLIPCTGGDPQKKIEEEVTAWGDGSRGIVAILWQGGWSGHVFIVENHGGDVVYMDPQDGRTEVSSYLRTAAPYGTEILRIDDKEFTDLIGECCENREG